MKKMKLLMGALMLVALALASCDDKVIPAEQLPVAAQTYIEQNFPGSSVMIVKKDNDVFSTTYEVQLDNGMELSFDGDGMLSDIDN